jgi:hypothetical protein
LKVDSIEDAADMIRWVLCLESMPWALVKGSSPPHHGWRSRALGVP